MQKNDLLEAEVVDLSYDGLGLVKVDGFPLFVDNTLPGERVLLRVTKLRKSFGFGRLEQLLVPSDERVEGLNLDYLRTGIADLGHLKYSEQLLFKQRQLIKVLQKTAGKPDFPVLETLPAPETTRYRNKAQVPVRMVSGQLETGFFRKNSHDLIPIEDFYIHHPQIDQLVKFLRDDFRLAGVVAYDETRHTGWLRNLVIRRAHYTGEMMLVLVATTAQLPFDKENFLFRLTKAFPAIRSVQINVNATNSSVILGSEDQLLCGEAVISDQMLGRRYQIAARAFYQVNTPQAEALYQIAYDFAGLRPTDTVVDAYSGIGTIGLGLADRVSQVYGMEVTAEAVENAKQNAVLNHIGNTHYEVGTAEQVLPRWLGEGVQPDIIFVDPPRKGLDESFITAATSTTARAVVYISCNPASFARDVVHFEAGGYRLDKVQPVDLFPQTHHVEAVALLTRRVNDI